MRRGAAGAALIGATAAGLLGAAGLPANATSGRPLDPASLLAPRGSRATVPPSPERCLALVGARCLTPSTLAGVYGISKLRAQGVTGKGVSVGIVVSFGSPTIREDVDVYSRQYGLPALDLEIVTPAGTPPAFDQASSDRRGWALETTLDVEAVHAVAPEAKIVLIETPTSETEGLAGFPEIITAERAVLAANTVDVLSQSFGATEATFDSPAQLKDLSVQLYPQAQAAGVTVLSGSGDNGPTDFRLDMKTLFNRPSVSWPASDPLVTAVGGTRVDVDATGARIRPDSAWGGTGVHGAGGGGRSDVFAAPPYQSSINSVTDGRRAVPDISLDADPATGLIVYGSFDGGNWSVAGGTSQAAPLLAGIVALADQAAGHRVGFLNHALYGLAASPDRGASSGIADLNRGNNALAAFPAVPGYDAVGGYDLATGLGTVLAQQFVPAIVAATSASTHRLAQAAPVPLGSAPSVPAPAAGSGSVPAAPHDGGGNGPSGAAVVFAALAAIAAAGVGLAGLFFVRTRR